MVYEQEQDLYQNLDLISQIQNVVTVSFSLYPGLFLDNCFQKIPFVIFFTSSIYWFFMELLSVNQSELLLMVDVIAR